MIQACPSCGTRYDVGRLGQGATFDCRKCAKPVEVGTPLPEDRRTSPGLALAGSILLVTPFLYANPFFGARFQEWPWKKLLDADDPRVMWTYVIWWAAAIWTLVSAFGVGRSMRSAVTTGFAAVLLMVCASPYAGLSIAQDRPLPWMLAVVALGAGFLLLGSPGNRGIARALAFTGGLTVLVAHSAHFETHPPGPRIAQIQILWEDLMNLVRGADVIGPGTRYAEFLFVSYWMIFACCAVGILVGLGMRARSLAWLGYPFVALASAIRPSISRDLTMSRLRQGVEKWFGVALLSFLVFALLYPTATKLRNDVQSEAFSGATLNEGLGILSRRLIQALVDDGIALWTLATLAVVDLVRARRESP